MKIPNAGNEAKGKHGIGKRGKVVRAVAAGLQDGSAAVKPAIAVTSVYLESEMAEELVRVATGSLRLATCKGHQGSKAFVFNAKEAIAAAALTVVTNK